MREREPCAAALSLLQHLLGAADRMAAEAQQQEREREAAGQQGQGPGQQKTGADKDAELRARWVRGGQCLVAASMLRASACSVGWPSRVRTLAAIESPSRSAPLWQPGLPLITPPTHFPCTPRLDSLLSSAGPSLTHALLVGGTDTCPRALMRPLAGALAALLQGTGGAAGGGPASRVLREGAPGWLRGAWAVEPLAGEKGGNKVLVKGISNGVLQFEKKGLGASGQVGLIRAEVGVEAGQPTGELIGVVS